MRWESLTKGRHTQTKAIANLNVHGAVRYARPSLEKPHSKQVSHWDVATVHGFLKAGHQRHLFSWHGGAYRAGLGDR